MKLRKVQQLVDERQERELLDAKVYAAIVRWLGSVNAANRRRLNRRRRG